MARKIHTVTFYNNFNRGDLHVVRSLIRYVMNNFPQYKYKLRHPNDPKVLLDIGIPTYWKNYIDLNDMKLKFDYRGYYQEYGVLFFNVQALCHDREFFNKHSFTLPAFHGIFKKTLKDALNFDMSDNVIDFIPQIDYSKYEISKIDEVIDPSYDNVLICNNDPLSEQSTTFDMTDTIKRLSNKYQSTQFYITNKFDYIRRNITFVNDITGNIGCDLNEISYLSTKCNTIIGKYSGPHTFCYVKENLLDTNKNMITFSPPSTMYGRDPMKWCDFGISSLSNDHAKFHNIPDEDDESRISKIYDIFKNR